LRRRCAARLTGDPRRAAIFRRLVGTDGRITVTIEAEEKSMRYQGVVPLAGTSLGESLEAYFASSEQLPTRVLLAADQACGAGMLVQKLPDGDAVIRRRSRRSGRARSVASSA